MKTTHKIVLGTVLMVFGLVCFLLGLKSESTALELLVSVVATIGAFAVAIFLILTDKVPNWILLSAFAGLVRSTRNSNLLNENVLNVLHVISIVLTIALTISMIRYYRKLRIS